MIALALILSGVLLAPDIIAPTPGMDALLNAPLAMVMADVMNVTFLEAVMLTFVISGLLLLAGFLIYPYNTKRLICGRAKFALRWIMMHPFMFIAAIILFFVIYFMGSLFYDTVYQSVKQYAINLWGLG